VKKFGNLKIPFSLRDLELRDGRREKHFTAENAEYAENPMSTALEFELRQAESPEQISAIRELFLEYANSLNFSLCF